MGRSSRRKQERRNYHDMVGNTGIVAAIRRIESQCTSTWPSWIESLDFVRAGRGHNGIPDWPDWCIVPMGLINNLLRAQIHWDESQASDFLLPDDMDVTVTSWVAAIYAWRQGKGIYYFDETLAEALLETEGTDALPTEALMHLPEWGICVVVPQRLQPLLGCSAFLAHLEWDFWGHWRELHVTFVTLNREGFQWSGPGPLCLESDTLSQAIDGSVRFYLGKDAERFHYNWSEQTMNEQVAVRSDSKRKAYQPILALLAYLGSTRADIADPSNRPVMKSDRKRHEATAGAIKSYEVGYRIGAQLRKGGCARDGGLERDGGADKTVAPHMRRAHWHHYWTGPKSNPNQRELIVRWVHPILVGGKDTIPTVRRVVGDTSGVPA